MAVKRRSGKRGIGPTSRRPTALQRITKGRKNSRPKKGKTRRLRAKGRH